MKALSLSLVMSIWSCSDESITADLNTSETASHYDNFSIVDGKLKFQSKQSLEAFMDKKPEDVRQMIKSISTESFKTLRPGYDETQTKKIDHFLKKKQEKIRNSNFLYSLKSGDNDEDIDLDDELISDEKFASVLNENRELYVGDSIYVYTTNGVYFTSIEKEDLLHEYLDNLGKQFTKSQMRQQKKQKILANQKREEAEISSLSLEPVEGELTAIDDNIMYYEPIIAPDDPYTGGGGSYGGGGSSTSDDYPILKPKQFGSCVYSPDSLWQQAFGERVKCNDYHDDEHRIQTQFYNENYYVYATIGAKAKYQKKRFIGWSESSTADFVELGINYVKYTYEFNAPQYNPHDMKYISYKYNGVTYDTDGYVMDYNMPMPNNWPIKNEGVPLVTLEIVINELGVNYDENSPYVFDGGQANDIIQDLITQAARSVPGLANDLDQNKVDIEIMKFSPGKATYIVNNRVLRDGSNASKNFDFNFLATYSSDEDYDDFSALLDQLNAKRYKDVSVDIYGAGLRHGVWKGKRIIGND